MKYIVILTDGMADEPIEKLGGKTPMMVANTPNIDKLCMQGECGLARTLYLGLPTGSDTANLSVLGYDPHLYYTGRSPVEALGLGIEMIERDVVYRLNFVALSNDELPYNQKTMIDHSGGHITDDEAYQLMDCLRENLKGCMQSELDWKLYNGVSYRHILIGQDIPVGTTLIPPHDILTQKITNYLPNGVMGEALSSLMEKSYDILMAHPVNQKRILEGKDPANSIWLWGEGKKPTYPLFKDKYGVNGAVITAVPLIQGLAAGMGMKSISVEGATGDYYTNYKGKAAAALNALAGDADFVFIHVEAPDECGHEGNLEHKISSIEKIDEFIVGTIVKSMTDYKMLIMPDHATPIHLRTHTTSPIPYLIYDSTKPKVNTVMFDEFDAEKGKMFEDAYNLMPYFLEV